MHDYQSVGTITHVIQLSVAPVFLLTAIGTLLSVMTNRLARIIDRARVLQGKLEDAPPERVDYFHRYLATLETRANYIGHAITLCTTAALLVCTLIAILFLGQYLRYDISGTVAIFFVMAMLALVAGLINFLREVYLAKRSLRIGPPRK